MIRKLINGKSKSITSAAMIIGLLSLGSRFLGVFRNWVLAGQFGAGETLDMYFAAFRIPDFFYNLIILGALSAGFIPVFTGYFRSKKEDEFELEREGWIFVNNLLNILLLMMTGVSVVLVVLAPWIVPFVTPGFTETQMAQTVVLTQIMFLSPIFLGISGIFGGILQSFRMFFLYSLAPIMYNIGIIIGALFFTKYWGVYGLAVGVVLGAILHMSIQFPQVWNLGYRYKFGLDLNSPKIRAIGKMMIPRVLSLGLSQVNILAMTIIASTIASGSISVFALSQDVQSVPLGVIGIPFALAAFPTMALYASQNDMGKFTTIFSRTIRQVLFLVIPLSVLMIVLRAQIVRVTLGHNKFDWEDTVLTLETVGFFAVSLFAQSIIPLLMRAFWVKNNTRTPFLAAAISVFANIILALVLGKELGVAGLALAFSVASILNMIILFAFLWKEYGELDRKNIFSSVLKVTFVSVIAGLVSRQALYTLSTMVDTRTYGGVLTQGFLAGMIGILVFVVMASWIRLSEFNDLKNSLKRRLFKTKVVVTEVAAEK